jgi:hypothetical protein
MPNVSQTCFDTAIQHERMKSKVWQNVGKRLFYASKQKEIVCACLMNYAYYVCVGQVVKCVFVL